MRFAYVAVGAAGILTSTMSEGRALPISQTISRSINPYTSQQTLASTPYTPDVDSSASPASGRSAQPTTAPEAFVNVQNPTDTFNTTVSTSDRQNVGGSQQTGSQPIMDPQYMAGQQVGFQAGSRAAASGKAPVEQQVSALFDQNANYNAGVQAGFEAAVQQHARAGINPALGQSNGINIQGMQTQPGSSSSLNASGRQNLEDGQVTGIPIEQDVEFLAGRRAGYDAGVKAGSSRNNRISTAQQAPALLGQNAIFNAGAEQGFEIGHQQHSQPDTNKAVGRQSGQGAQPQGAGRTSSQVSQEAGFAAGQPAGFQAGMQSGVSRSGGSAPPGLFSQNPYFNAGAQQGLQAAEQQRANAGVNQTGSLQSGTKFGQNAQSQAGLSSGLNTSGRQNLGGSQQVGPQADPEFLAGQQVGFQAGANQGANGMSSSGQEISSLFGQNAQFNAGVQQGFAAGFEQRARENSNQSVGPQSGINASQTGQAQVSQASDRQSIGASQEPGSQGDEDPQFVAGLRVGIQAGRKARSSGAGQTPQEVAAFFGQNAPFNAGVEQGFEEGYEEAASAKN